jgi:hypothetical protein
MNAARRSTTYGTGVEDAPNGPAGNLRGLPDAAQLWANAEESQPWRV